MERLLALYLLGALALLAQIADQPVDPGASNPAPTVLTPLKLLDTKLPYWLRLGGDYRARWEDAGHIRFGPLTDGYLLSRIRLKMTIAPVSWFSIVGESTDARIFANDHVANAPPFQNTWDIWQAYAELGSDKEGWFDVKVGRQVMSFGDERVIGPSEWLNEGRTYDAVRLDFHPDGALISVFSSSTIVSRDGVIDHHIQGNNLHGLYASFKKLIPSATFEPYVLWRLAPANIHLSENAGRGALNEPIIGLRWVGKLPSHFEYGTEMNKEYGSLGPDSIKAWAGYWHIGRVFPNSPGLLHPYVEGQYASGTKDPTSRTWGTFDQVYPSAHDKLDLADQVGRRNIEQIRGGVIEKLGKKWELRQTYESFWLASARDALYGSAGAPLAQSVTGKAGRHVGQELDLISVYDYSRDIQLGFGYGHLFTGEFLNRTTPGKDYDYPYAFIDYKF